MKIPAHILLVACLGACSFDSSAPVLGSADDSGVDLADAGDIDPVFDADLPIEDGKHLLVSEVKTTGSGTEFIEIYNPTDRRIDLGDYYLSDTKSYEFLPGAFGSGPRPSVNNTDFIARFPAGSSIDLGETLVIAIKPIDFDTIFGAPPDYAIGGTQGDEEMLPAFPSGIGALVTLTDSGEVIALVYWDGAADLVVDIDIVNAGAETTEDNGLAIKTNTSVDGPDSGSTASTYLKDLGTMGLMPLAATRDQSYQRIANETGSELQTGPGNGLFGHDETSEDTASTWTLAAPSPGVVSGI